MNCFNHRDTTALGLCKSCGKGLCEECLAEIQDGLACKSRCEERANRINRIIDMNSAILQVNNKRHKSAAVLYLALSAVFTMFAIWAWAGEHRPIMPLVYFMLGSGLVFLLFGTYSLRKNTRYPELK